MTSEIVESVILPDFSGGDSFGKDGALFSQSSALAIVGEVKAEVDVVLGGASIKLSELFSMGSGSVIRLDSRVGEAVKVCLDGKVIALGDIVVVGDNFGIKISKNLME